MEKNLKSGTCPKCGSGEVYTDKTTYKRSERLIIGITGLTRIFLDIYICTNCGYFEEFIPEEDLKDEKLIEKIKKNWEKVK